MTQQPNAGADALSDMGQYFLQAAEDSFHAFSDTRGRVERIAKTARDAVEQHYRTPEALKGFIEENGTPVYIIPKGMFSSFQAFITMKQLGFSYGYTPKPSSDKGIAAYRKLVFWLTRHENQSLIYFDETRFEQGVMILQAAQFNVPFLSHQLHHWMACRAGLAGYSEQAQRLYEKFWKDHNGQVSHALLKNMDTQDIIDLKQAINRDMEALKFLRQMVEEVFTPANQAKSQLSGIDKPLI